MVLTYLLLNLWKYFVLQVGEKNYPCPNLYKFSVEEDKRIILSYNVEKVSFIIKNLKPFSQYTWRLLYDNDELYSNIIQTLEDGELRILLLFPKQNVMIMKLFCLCMVFFSSVLFAVVLNNMRSSSFLLSAGSS